VHFTPRTRKSVHREPKTVAPTVQVQGVPKYFSSKVSSVSYYHHFILVLVGIDVVLLGIDVVLFIILMIIGERHDQ